MVIDTSIFIEFLRAKDKTKTLLYNLPEEVEPLISAVSVFELFAGATSPAKKADIELIISDLEVLPFTEEVAQKAAQILISLKRKNQLIEFRDIFIASTALVHDQPIHTLNTKHFSRIDELVLV